ncbi:MAG: toxin-antitoxin system HicB family antitoxin [Rhodopirellula sp. JB053]
MATLSLRMRDDLKAKAQELASKQGVSLNSYINATLAATIAQTETLADRRFVLPVDAGLPSSRPNGSGRSTSGLVSDLPRP